VVYGAGIIYFGGYSALGMEVGGTKNTFAENNLSVIFIVQILNT